MFWRVDDDRDGIPVNGEDVVGDSEVGDSEVGIGVGGLPIPRPAFLFILVEYSHTILQKILTKRTNRQ